MINILEDLRAIAAARSVSGNAPIPGQVELNECKIQHGVGKYYDISVLVSEIHLFEDIEQVGVTGYLQIVDNINLIRNGLILGEELLWLKFATGGAGVRGADLENFAIDYGSDNDAPLYIHKIEEIESPETVYGTTTQSVITYRLHFCSTEMITNDRVRISKTYQGTISDIVYDVMTKDLGVTKKPVTITETKDLHHFVVPNIRPFDFLLSLADKARCPTGEAVRGPQPSIAQNMFKGFHSDFVFFETARRKVQSDGGWFFVPLQREMGDDLKFTLNNSATTTGGEATSAQSDIINYPAVMLRSISFDFVTNGDKWFSVADGNWSGLNIRHNGYTKSFDVYKSDYLKHLKENRYSHASKTPVYWPPDPAWRKISEWPEANVSLSSSTAKSVSNINTNTRRADYPWRKTDPEHSLSRKLQVNHMLNYQRIQCEMYGISGLQIGKNAFAEFPQIGLASGSPKETGIVGSEEKYPEDRNNNTWMITKLAHHVVFNDDVPYTTTMELANTMRTTERDLPAYPSLVQMSRAANR